MPTVIDHEKQNVSIALYNLGISVPITVVLLLIIAYCVYQIVRTIIRYRKNNTEVAERRAKTSVASSLGTNSVNVLLDPGQDDEIYFKRKLEEEKNNPDANKDNDFDKFTKSIQDSFKAYTTYNDKIQKFYQNTKGQDAPDRIDEKVLLSDNDNW